MSTIPTDLVATARMMLELGEVSRATHCLRAALRIEPACLEAHNLIEERVLPGNFSEAFGIDAQISPDDDVFRFFVNHPSCINPIRDYLSDGWRSMVELSSLLESIGRPLGRCGSFLEFACGFGRLSRHLVKAVPDGALDVSDVVPGSVDFLKHRLRVGGFYSVHGPEELELPQRYEVVFVLSLFSHLPEHTWSDWLERLYGALEVNGVLIVTTHGEKSARVLGVTLPERGFLFIPSSESMALSGDHYGSTFTSTPYVRQVIAERLPGARTHEFPAKFWGNQDAFAIVRSAAN